MPSDPTDEQLDLRRKGRQRLIGAVALALVAVVFVPMLLDPDPRGDRAEPMLAIPPRDGAPPIAKAPQPPVQPPAAAASTDPKPAPVPATTSKPASAAAKAGDAGTRPAAAVPKLVGFAVQVGAFRDEKLLAQAREKLAAARVVHYTERIEGSGGDLTRLRAGPFPTREAADKAASQLKRAGLDGVQVVPLP